MKKTTYGPCGENGRNLFTGPSPANPPGEYDPGHDCMLSMQGDALAVALAVVLGDPVQVEAGAVAGSDNYQAPIYIGFPDGTLATGSEWAVAKYESKWTTGEVQMNVGGAGRDEPTGRVAIPPERLEKLTAEIRRCYA